MQLIHVSQNTRSEPNPFSCLFHLSLELVAACWNRTAPHWPPFRIVWPASQKATERVSNVRNTGFLTLARARIRTRLPMPVHLITHLALRIHRPCSNTQAIWCVFTPNAGLIVGRVVDATVTLSVPDLGLSAVGGSYFFWSRSSRPAGLGICGRCCIHRKNCDCTDGYLA